MKVRIFKDIDRSRQLPKGFYLTVVDAAQFLGLSQETVRRAIDRGDIKAERETSPGKSGWMFVIKSEDLNRFRGI